MNEWPLIPADDPFPEKEVVAQGSEGTYFSDTGVTPSATQVSVFYFLLRVKVGLTPSQSQPTLRKPSTVISRRTGPPAPGCQPSATPMHHDTGSG